MPSSDIKNVAGIVRVHGVERPDHTALVLDDRRPTWSELLERSEADGPGARRRGRRRRRSCGVPRQERHRALRGVLRCGDAQRRLPSTSTGVWLRPRCSSSSTMPMRRCWWSGPTSCPILDEIAGQSAEGREVRRHRWRPRTTTRTTRTGCRHTMRSTPAPKASTTTPSFQLYSSGTTGPAQGRDAVELELLQPAPDGQGDLGTRR